VARRSRERGAAVVDFVLVLVVLVPVFLGILQVALVLFVRNTLTAAASEGARYAATLDRSPEEGRHGPGPRSTVPSPAVMRRG
jgi:Flp pilus assembly protein TadG